MKHKKKIIGVVILAVLGAIAGTRNPIPEGLYPNSLYTKGVAATQDFALLTKLYDGKTYSQSHRDVEWNDKHTVCVWYAENCKKGKVEIDHFIPLALGGSNAVGNLWAQPERVSYKGKDYGFHAKDRLESLLISRMKQGAITPFDAQECIRKDWVKCYDKNVGDRLGAAEGEDLDDEVSAGN